MTFVLSWHGSGLASRMATQKMTDKHNDKSVEGLISDIIEHGETHLNFHYNHEDCPGISVGAYEEQEDLSTSPCSVLDCEEPATDIPFKIEGRSPPSGLCVDHFWYWFENEVELTCEECAAWFEDIEVSE